MTADLLLMINRKCNPPLLNMPCLYKNHFRTYATRGHRPDVLSVAFRIVKFCGWRRENNADTDDQEI